MIEFCLLGGALVCEVYALVVLIGILFNLKK
jgi:hypothetical protein